MCQLLGMNCNVPTDICFSFTGFQARGGGTDVHKDGWGIAFFEGKGVRLFLDPQPSAISPVAELVRHYPIHSLNVIAHIRKATQGNTNLENTHPFQRELWGHYWIFAHNGHLQDFFPEFTGSFMPVGQTDSERAFCWLLQTLSERFGNKMPEEQTLFTALHELTLELAQYGQCNYLLSWGKGLMAHCSTSLTYIERKAPFTQAHLKDQDVSVDFQQLTRPQDRVAVIATTPLTDNEEWHVLAPGTLCFFNQGILQRQAKTLAGPASPLTGNI